MTAPPNRTARPRVALFVTCMVDTLYPEVGVAAVELLERHGAAVLFPERQTCCGQPAFNAGYRNEARDMARRFLDCFWPLLDRGDLDAVVAPSGSCIAMVKSYYRVLFDRPEDATELRKVKELSRATFELTEYLVDILGIRQLETRHTGKVAYHPCCHLLRELGVDAQPRKLLGLVEGADIVDLPGAEECCGFGGLFAIKNAELSTAMGRRKVRNAVDSGADIVAMNDVSCMTHLNGLLRREGHRCRAVHIAQLLSGSASRPHRQEGTR